MPITNIPGPSPDASRAHAGAADIEADFWRELAEIEAESIGWQSLSPGSYFHVGTGNSQTIEVVGIPSADMANTNVLWLF